MTQATVHASPTAGQRQRALANLLLIATAVAGVESLAGIFGTDDNSALERTAYLLAMNWIGMSLGVLGYIAATHIDWARPCFWRRVFAATSLAFVPQAIVVWASAWIVAGGPGPEAFWLFLAYSFIFGGAFIAAFVAPIMDKAAPQQAAAASPASTFAGRLPFRLQGADLWAVCAEGHYIRVLTSRGEALIRLRLADAVLELGCSAGAQTHRSWWVARIAVMAVRRRYGRIRAIVLPDEREVPVSRAGAEVLKRSGWV